MSVFLPYVHSRSHNLLATSFYSTNIRRTHNSPSLSFPFFKKRLSCRTLLFLSLPPLLDRPIVISLLFEAQNCISLSFSLFRRVSLSRDWIVRLCSMWPCLSLSHSQFDRLFPSDSAVPLSPLSLLRARARAPHEEARSVPRREPNGCSGCSGCFSISVSSLASIVTGLYSVARSFAVRSPGPMENRGPTWQVQCGAINKRTERKNGGGDLETNEGWRMDERHALATRTATTRS